MTSSYSDLYSISGDPVLLDRVRYALAVAAVNVMSEDAATMGHALRVVYAVSILKGVADVEAMTLGILTNPSIAQEAVLKAGDGSDGIPDSDILFAVNSLFNAFAGVHN